VCSAVGPPFFLLMLLTSHELRIRLGCRGPMVFLDKTSIHQTDENLKKKGICHLAAFLKHSKCMMVLYSETYLRKLWTVYELASMLVLQPEGKVVVLSTLLPRLLLSGMTTIYVMTNIDKCLSLYAIQDKLPVGGELGPLVMTLPSIVLQFWWFRRLVRLRQELTLPVENFKIQSTTCAQEEDRPLVEGNIVAFMRALEEVDPEANDEAALEAFNRLVRMEVPSALNAACGRRTLPYRYVAVMTFGLSMRIFDQAVACISGETPWPDFCYHAVVVFTGTFAVLPLWCAIILRVAALRPLARLGCNRVTACLMAQVTLVTLCGFAAYGATCKASSWAAASDSWQEPCIFAGIVVFLFSFTTFFYWEAWRTSGSPALSHGLAVAIVQGASDTLSDWVPTSSAESSASNGGHTT